MTQWIIWSLVALYGLALILVVLWLRRQRRARMRLEWPRSMTQHQMERWGACFLEGLGWEVRVGASQASRSILQCLRPGDELFVVFLRDGAFFGRLMVMVGKLGGFVMGRLVVVLYDPPLETMITVATEQKIPLVHFRELGCFTSSENARVPGVLAAREVARRVRVVQSP